MNFFVYHNFNLGLVYLLCHNISNRTINKENQTVTGTYNNIDVTFYFNSFSNIPHEIKKDGYHVICREEAVHESFFLEDMNTYQHKLGYPNCLPHEYKIINSQISSSSYNWVLFWNFGENKFLHLAEFSLDKNKEFSELKKIVDNTIFFSDNFIQDNTPYAKINPNKLLKVLTNDVFMWNYYAQITWANEFKNLFKHLNPPHKLCISFRSPKPYRIEICEKLGKKNLDGVYISYSSSFFEKRKGEKDPNWEGIEYDNTYHILKNIKNLNINKIGEDSETDLENLEASGNRKDSRFEIDFYFRILYQGKMQLLDETHSYLLEEERVPLNLSEKTYILLLANIPFISTHYYPIDLIQKHILDLEHPYYREFKEMSNNTDKLVEFIERLIENFDEMYPKIKEWTTLVHEELQRKLQTENSFLEHMTTKI